MATLFSTKLPTLQLAWDATSLRALQFCPRFYQLSILEGWRSDTIDLDFGVMAHSAMDKYDRARVEGRSHDEAQLAALEYVLMTSGGYTSIGAGPTQVWVLPEGQEGWKPWGGRYLMMWRCTATQPYGKKGKSGGKLKCPNAKAHVWWPGHGPTACPECFSPTQTEERWLADKPGKDRASLIRTVVWWTEELKDSPLRTLTLADGTPMVEVNFQVELPWGFHNWPMNSDMPYFQAHDPNDAEEERFVLCGYWDGGVGVGSENFVRERKTTGKSLTKQYWDGFSPNIQIDTYDLVVEFLPEVKGLEFRGVLVEAAQTLVGGSRFGWRQIYRSAAQREETLKELNHWLGLAVEYARNDYWPMAKAQCPICPMKKVCRLEPGKRQMFLEANYKRVRWNPLEER